MTLKFEQNPTKLWHGMTREDTAKHEKTREGTARHEKTRQGTARHEKARARGHRMFPTRFVNMRANIAAYVGEFLLVENEEQSIHDHGIFTTRPQRRESSYILRTVLIAANSIPLLATILTTLPNYIVWLALGYPAIWLSMTRPILITRITVDLFKTVLSFSILIFLWANFKKVF